MGQVILLKCKHCGNEWEHYDGVGFESKPLQGNKKENRTGDADDRICCPKCGSEDFERDDQKIVAFGIKNKIGCRTFTFRCRM